MKTLILWGKHPAHGNTWLKLSDSTSQRYRMARRREGWECVVWAKGVKP